MYNVKPDPEFISILAQNILLSVHVRKIATIQNTINDVTFRGLDLFSNVCI